MRGTLVQSCLKRQWQNVSPSYSQLWRHPCTELFKVLPIFDPAKVSGLKPDIKKYVQVIPSLSNVSTEEWHRYIRMDKSDAGEVSAVEWWAAREDRMPTLAPLAALYLHLPTTSVDAERLFSHYSALLTEHRRSLTEENVKMMLIAKFNTRYQLTSTFQLHSHSVVFLM